MNTPDNFDDEQMKTRILQISSVKEELNEFITKNVITVDLIEN